MMPVDSFNALDTAQIKSTSLGSLPQTPTETLSETSMASKPLNILVLEDSPVDMALLKRHFKQGNLLSQLLQVDSNETFRQALQDHTWDVIISDYHLPGFSVLAALEAVREQALDLPFIVISGIITDIEAVAIMKAGAHDFIPKDNLARLLPVIDRELKEAHIRRERRELSQQLQDAREFAELANQRKSRVLAFVAHEFKNPLKAIESFSYLLAQDKTENANAQHPLSPKQAQAVEAIQMACSHIRNLLTDILDIAPIEAGRVDLHYETIDVSALLHDVVVLLSQAAQQKKVTIAVEVQEETLTLQADSKRLKQVFINLLSNAIKYTHTGDTVRITVNALPATESTALQSDSFPALVSGSGGLEFSIQDNGPGIAGSELKNLFADYYRVRNVFSQQQEGLGLGLALTKTLVELHRGTLSVSSQVGVGSIFTVRLPLSPPSI
jgi:signal transduction histidine kinase